MDANELRNKVDKRKIESQEIVLRLDYNFDQMVKYEGDDLPTMDNSLLSGVNNENIKDAMIYIETLGNNSFLKKTNLLNF